MLAPGDEVVFVHEHQASAGEMPVTYDALAHDVHTGDRIAR